MGPLSPVKRQNFGDALRRHQSLRRYAGLIAETGIDVVRAYTPPPVGELSLPEVRAAWGDKTIIWVNIPETIFWFGAEEAKRYTIDLLKSGAPGNALVLSFTEMGMGSD